MPLTFRSPFLLYFGFSLLQTKDLSPGNADVPVGLDLLRHISCRRGRQRSQGDKVAEPSRLQRARCPRSFEGSNRRERGRPARMKEERHSCLSLCRQFPYCRYEKLVALGILPVRSPNRQDACSPSFLQAQFQVLVRRFIRRLVHRRHRVGGSFSKGGKRIREGGSSLTHAFAHFRIHALLPTLELPGAA